uniref:Ig-like domain-containing protein n=1 Tax=Esox lucius TaxID=8010 RepID=A0A3P8YDG4_ESOLU
LTTISRHGVLDEEYSDHCNVLLWYDNCYFIGEDTVTQPPGDVITTEGEQVTLDCTFNTQDTNICLFWYKRGSNDHPNYMLMRPKYGTGDNAADFKGRFHADLDTKTNSIPLTIQRLQLSDSAVYYCALRPTVTTGYTDTVQKHIVGQNDNTPVSTVFTVYVRQKPQLGKDIKPVIHCNKIVFVIFFTFDFKTGEMDRTYQ